MNWLAETCMLSYGWRRALWLLLAGAVAGLSVPPFFFLPALFVAFPVWVWCLDGAETGTGIQRLFGSAFTIGFFFGLGYFLVAIHWVGAAFFVDGGWLLGVMPFAVLILAAVLALFWGLASALAHYFWSDSAWRILALATALTLAEFARGHLFTGFPFDLLGYALTANDQMAQLASVIGVYGLTALAAVLAPLPALIWPGERRALTRRLLPLFAIIVALTGQIGYGQYRLNSQIVEARSDIKLRLVQPAIPQAEKWRDGSRSFVMERLFSLSDAKLGPDGNDLMGVTHLVWPESAMPFFLAEQPNDLAQIARLLPLGKHLITGAPYQEFGTPPGGDAYNSILVIDSDGETVARYDKTHLVPFGEYLPLPGLFNALGIKQFVAGDGWTKGDARRAISIAGGPAFLPLICYEAVFSGDLGANLDEVEFILNLTNDAWFAGSIGPAQHFHHARIRAVEEGKALVRLANTGVTALVDPLGQISARLVEGEPGVIDVSPQKPLPFTLFSRLRHWPLLVALLLALTVLIVIKRRENYS